ncbi:MFS transporter [Sulfitobacter aestuariivivens]|uniref:MFS transporter n=1 Tax=Sulfitobacter aestuariivivens TaxID=2766981 RepID=UPI0036107227
MSEKTPFALIFALWGAGLGAAAQYGKVSVIFDLLPQVYPDAGAAIGFIVSLVGFVGILFGVAAGLLVARIRYRRALLGALWIGAGVSAFQAVLPALPLMLAARMLEGVSHLAIVVAAPTLIAQISAPRDRGLTLTLWGTFFGVAFAVLAWAGRPLALSLGVPALFMAHAAYMAVFALYLSARLRALPEEGAAAVFLEASPAGSRYNLPFPSHFRGCGRLALLHVQLRVYPDRTTALY